MPTGTPGKAPRRDRRGPVPSRRAPVSYPRIREEPSRKILPWPLPGDSVPDLIPLLSGQRWLARGSLPMSSVHWRDHLALGDGPRPAVLALVDVRFGIRDTSLYLLLLQRTPAFSGFSLRPEVAASRALWSALGPALARGARWRTPGGFVEARPTGLLRLPPVLVPPHGGIRPLGVEQSNTSLRVGSRYLFKFYRRPGPHPSPDVEIPLLLWRRTRFHRVPPPLATLVYRPRGSPPRLLGVLSPYLRHHGDLFQRFLRSLRREFREPSRASPRAEIAACRTLGAVSADLHVALARIREPRWAPRGISPRFRQDLQIAWSREVETTLRVLGTALPRVPPEVRPGLQCILRARTRLREWIREAESLQWRGLLRIRVHGDYHLGQILDTPRGFVLVDFEGEPARTPGERAGLHPPLKDLGGLLRSLDYVARIAARDPGSPREPDLMARARRWRDAAEAALVEEYRRRLSRSGESGRLAPEDPEEFRKHLRFHLRRKLLYEVRYEIAFRPAWVGVPLAALRQELDLPP